MGSKLREPLQGLVGWRVRARVHAYLYIYIYVEGFGWVPSSEYSQFLSLKLLANDVVAMFQRVLMGTGATLSVANSITVLKQHSVIAPVLQP